MGYTKKISISNSSSEWQGLWYDGDFHRYNSTVFNIKDLRDYKGNFKILMIKNRFHEKGDNRPNFVFKIAGSNYEDPKLLRLEEPDLEPDQYIRLADAIEIGRDLLYDFDYGYSIDDLVVEIESFMTNKAVSGVLLEDVMASQLLKSEPNEEYDEFLAISDYDCSEFANLKVDEECFVGDLLPSDVNRIDQYIEDMEWLEDPNFKGDSNYQLVFDYDEIFEYACVYNGTVRRTQ